MSNKVKVKYGNTELFSTTYPYNALDIKYKNDIISTIYPEEHVLLLTKDNIFDGDFSIAGYKLPTTNTYCTENIIVSNELPYEELEYIESTGTQWIDTGLPVNTDILKMKTSFYKTSSDKQQILFGGCQDSVSAGMYFVYTENSDTSEKVLLFTSSGTTTYHVAIPNYGLEVGPRDIEYSKSGWSSITMTVNGVSATASLSGSQPSASNINFGLFCDISNGTPIYLYKCKLYYYSIWTANGLVRNFIPVRRKSDNVICMYDTVTNTYFENQGTGQFIAGPVVTYTKLDYIESSGTQYINTNKYPTASSAISFEAQMVNGYNVSYNYLGSRNRTDNSTRFGVFTSSQDTNYGYFFGETAEYLPAIILTDKHIFYLDNSKFVVDNVTKSTFSATISGQTLPITIFAFNNSDGVWCNNYRLFSYKYYENDNLLQYFIPVKRSGSNEYGLLDKINHIFYRNIGTGEFIPGPPVTTGFTQLEYIESTGTQYIDTGLYYDGTDSIKFRMVANAYVNDQQYIGISADSFRALYVDTYNDKWYFGLGGQEYATEFSTCAFSNDLVFSYDATNHVYKINSYAQTLGSPGTTFNSGTILICKRYGSSVLFSGKIYYFQCGQHNFIPVRRNSDNVVCMYDTVTNQYFENAGTGEFIGGPEV